MYPSLDAVLNSAKVSSNGPRLKTAFNSHHNFPSSYCIGSLCTSFRKSLLGPWISFITPSSCFYFSFSDLLVFTWDLNKDWLQESQKSVGDHTKVLIFKVMMIKHFIDKQLVFLHHKIFFVGDTLTKMGYYLIPWATIYAFRLGLLVLAHLQTFTIYTLMMIHLSSTCFYQKKNALNPHFKMSLSLQHYSRQIKGRNNSNVHLRMNE